MGMTVAISLDTIKRLQLLLREGADVTESDEAEQALVLLADHLVPCLELAEARVQFGSYGDADFTNHSKRMWTEDEARNMVNAALLHLAAEAGGRLVIATSAMMENVLNMGALSMALSDDDSTLLITGMHRL